MLPCPSFRDNWVVDNYLAWLAKKRREESNPQRYEVLIIEYTGSRLTIIIQSSAAIFVPLFFRTKNRNMTARVSMTPSTMVARTTISPRGLGDIMREYRWIRKVVLFSSTMLSLCWEWFELKEHNIAKIKSSGWGKRYIKRGENIYSSIDRVVEKVASFSITSWPPCRTRSFETACLLYFVP